MSYIQSIVLGIIQGLTEFLPVSSSGHLALAEKFFNTSQGSLLFEVGVHFGTVLSILFVYRKIIYSLLKELLQFFKSFEFNNGARLSLLIFISALPAGVIGVVFKSYIEEAFASLFVVGVCFIITGLLLFWTEKRVKQVEGDRLNQLGSLSEVNEITYKQALIIGCAQAFAILPGISRSGSTIAIALSLGVSRKSAAMFSFLMSIPVILGASTLQALNIKQLPQEELIHLLISVTVSFVFGLIGLYLILQYVKKARLSRFSWYLWILGVLSIGYHFTGG